MGRTTRDVRLAVGQEIRRLRLDTGLTVRQLASASSVSPGYLSLLERGLREPSLAVLVAIATALGGDLRVRVYPGTGPRLRDPISARMVEALLAVVHSRWLPNLEVPVYRPVRGVIDLVLTDPTALVVIASEVQSEVPRLEQQIRWAHQKGDALPSATIARTFADGMRIDRLLVLRNTRANRDLVNRFASIIATEYPARSRDAVQALTSSDAPWPGSAVVWVKVDGDVATLMEAPPRGVAIGR